MNDPFQVLEVAETADDAAIKKAYLRKVRAFPPDREPQRFQAIREAFEAIRTRRNRLRYRLFRADPPTPTALLEGGTHSPGPGRRPTLDQLRQALRQTLTDPAD